MALLSAVLLLSAFAAIDAASKCGKEFFTPKVDSVYCGKFEVNSVPVKIKLVFKSADTVNIFGSVYGFDMYCMESSFAMCEDGEINLDPKKEADKNCLRKQFEGVDEHMSSLTVEYDKSKNKVQLISDSMKNVFLEKSDKCDSDDYKFTIMDDNGDSQTMRRLTYV